jgi:hypothetical protein
MLAFEPRTPNPEPRTPNPEPRTPKLQEIQHPDLKTTRSLGGRALQLPVVYYSRMNRKTMAESRECKGL